MVLLVVTVVVVVVVVEVVVEVVVLGISARKQLQWVGAMTKHLFPTCAHTHKHTLHSAY